MSEDAFAARMKRLEERIESARASRAEPPSRASAKFTQSSIAWRMVTELVAGMLLGFGIGYGLDSLFGTLPVFLVLFVLLGFAAGVRVMMRTAADVQHGRSEAALMRGPTQTGPDRAEMERKTDGG